MSFTAKSGGSSRRGGDKLASLLRALPLPNAPVTPGDPFSAARRLLWETAPHSICSHSTHNGTETSCCASKDGLSTYAEDQFAFSGGGASSNSASQWLVTAIDQCPSTWDLRVRGHAEGNTPLDESGTSEAVAPVATSVPILDIGDSELARRRDNDLSSHVSASKHSTVAMESNVILLERSSIAAAVKKLGLHIPGNCLDDPSPVGKAPVLRGMTGSGRGHVRSRTIPANAGAGTARQGDRVLRPTTDPDCGELPNGREANHIPRSKLARVINPRLYTDSHFRHRIEARRPNHGEVSQLSDFEYCDVINLNDFPLIPYRMLELARQSGRDTVDATNSSFFSVARTAVPIGICFGFCLAVVIGFQFLLLNAYRP
eukprot:GHVU01027680.1.p1 GENE.GHVU01027680.1~~GHVU01027680.1.p1  ORF type:complete len:373 (-),score=11.24 GHVU01027680.1:1303-2421(-)